LSVREGALIVETAVVQKLLAKTRFFEVGLGPQVLETMGVETLLFETFARLEKGTNFGFL